MPNIAVAQELLLWLSQHTLLDYHTFCLVTGASARDRLTGLRAHRPQVDLWLLVRYDAGTRPYNAASYRHITKTLMQAPLCVRV